MAKRKSNRSVIMTLVEPEERTPLGTEGWSENGKPADPERMKRIRVFCNCKWRGNVTELVTGDKDTTIRCPQCLSAGWIYA